MAAKTEKKSSPPQSRRVLAPAALLGLGWDYAEAAAVLFRSDPGTPIPLVPVPLYLLGHAIELELKAYLSAEGIGERELRDIGHDLALVLKRARDAGLDALLTLSAAEEKALEMIAPFYGEKELEYSSVSAGEGRLVSYPDPALLRSLVARLYAGLREHCGRRTSEQRKIAPPAKHPPQERQGGPGPER
jgi:hypothetical protein